MQVPQLKGSAYMSTLSFIETHYGSTAKERVLQRLSVEDRALVGGMLLPIVWYPLAPFPRLLQAMEAEFGKGDLALATQRGTWAAIHDMKTVHKVLLKFVTPQWVLDKAIRLWPNFHTSGRWEVVKDGEHAARATLYELGVVDDALCATLKGWMIGLTSLAGVKNPTVVHTDCRVRGARGCVYQVQLR